MSKDGAMTAKEYYTRLLDRDEDIFREITRFTENEAAEFRNLLMNSFFIEVKRKRLLYTLTEKDTGEQTADKYDFVSSLLPGSAGGWLALS